MSKTVQPYVLAAVARCLDSGEYSDLTITCGSDVHKVHKVIVCTQSDFLAAAIRFGGKETKQANIKLPDDESTVVKLLVKYFYTGDYKCELERTSEGKSHQSKPSSSYTQNFPHTCDGYYCEAYLCPHHSCETHCNGSCTNFNCQYCSSETLNFLAKGLLIHAKVYELADKYNIVGLKELSKGKFEIGCSAFWDTDTFPVAAQYAFSTTVEEDKGLRDIVIFTIATRPQLIKKPEIQVLLKEFGSLSLGVLLKKASDHRWF